MAVKLVVFDMAGTTVKDEQHVAGALQNALAASGFNITLDDINLVMGYPKPEAIKRLLAQYADQETSTDTELINTIHKLFVDEMIEFYKTNMHIDEKPHASQVFAILRDNGIKVAIDTGFSRPIADAIFDRLGWRQGEHFDVSVTSDEVANGRPYPDMIFKAMSACDVNSSDEVAKVGDTASDIQQGIAAGCKYVIGVNTGAYSNEDLQKENCTHIIADLQELLDIFSIQNHVSL